MASSNLGCSTPGPSTLSYLIPSKETCQKFTLREERLYRDSVDVDISAGGLWLKAKETEKPCVLHLCSPKGYTWRSFVFPMKYYDADQACEALVHYGLKDFLVWGDDTMLHIFQAMLITLSGDFETGSLKQNEPDCLKNCRGEMQFSVQCKDCVTNWGML